MTQGEASDLIAQRVAAFLVSSPGGWRVWLMYERDSGEGTSVALAPMRPGSGLALARETGHPAVLLDDILKQKGTTAEEVRASILPVLITIE
jgi:hypothetical protein